jgi:hypothetical protein
MAFSAGVVESLIVLDRPPYLNEMGCEKACMSGLQREPPESGIR